MAILPYHPCEKRVNVEQQGEKMRRSKRGMVVVGT